MQKRPKQPHYIPLLKEFLRSQPKYVRAIDIVQKWREQHPEWGFDRRGCQNSETGMNKALGTLLGKLLNARGNKRPHGKLFENIYSEV